MFSTAAVHFSLSNCSRGTTDLKAERYDHNKLSEAEYTGYWLSYVGGICNKCNCSLTASTIYLESPNAQKSFNLVMNVNQSDCPGDDSCTCLGYPDYLIGRYDADELQINANMGDYSCLGVRTQDGYGIYLNCHGPHRSETIVLTKN